MKSSIDDEFDIFSAVEEGMYDCVCSLVQDPMLIVFRFVTFFLYLDDLVRPSAAC